MGKIWGHPTSPFSPYGRRLVPYTSFSCTGSSFKWLKQQGFHRFPWEPGRFVTMRDVFLILHLMCSPPWFQLCTGRVASAKLQWVNACQMTWVLVNSFWVSLIYVLNKKAFERRMLWCHYSDTCLKDWQALVAWVPRAVVLYRSYGFVEGFFFCRV